MKTIGQYRDDIKALMKRVADIKAKAEIENRNLTVDEVAAIKDLNAEVKNLTDMVLAIEENESIRASLETTPAPQTVQRRPALSVQVKDKEKFHTIGDQMVAVMRAGMPGGHIDPRLYNAATGLNETSPSDGGFLVQTDFSSELLQEVYATGLLAPRCRRISISGNSNGIKINGVDETSRASTRSGGIVGYWKDEAAQKTASKPKFRQIELTLHKLIGLCYATDELLADAAALEGFIRQAFAAEFGFLLDDAIIRGTGAGQPLGILNAGCLVTVTKEAGQGADTIVWENVVKMYARLFAGSRANSIWLINQAAESQLMQMAMSVGTGGVPVYLPAGGASQSPYATLFGRPVIAIEQCSALGDVGDIIFGDFNGYILAEKGGIESAMSIHVKFDYDESVFRFVMRVDGQPVRASSLTPYKGSDALSHFVALAAR
jgi:HK97 family phage major capsid protein